MARRKTKDERRKTREVKKRKGQESLYERLTTPKAVRWFWIVIASPFALVLFLLALTAMGVFGRLPSFEELENPKSNIATQIISEDGKQIGTFHIQNRTYISYDELSTNLVAALVSTEDVRFYGHSGIDFISLGRVALKTIGMGQRQGGGSTISQQLAKNLFERKGWIVTDKLKEWLTALKLEYNYTKEEIIAMYLNIVPYGSNAFGIKAAAHTFFDKEPSEVGIEEAAMLVGVVNAPTAYSPVRNPERALARRNTVMRRMEKVGYISEAQYDSLSQLPIVLHYQPVSHNEGTGTYFREMWRLVMQAQKPTRRQYNNDYDYQYELDRWETNPIYGWVHKNQKADGTPYDIYRDGLKIYTTINSSMQRYAEEAVEERLRSEIQPRMDAQYKRTGVIFQDQSREQVERIIAGAMRYSDRYREMEKGGASREQIRAAFNVPVQMRVFTFGGERDTVMTPRDSILHHKKIMRASFVAVEPQTGHLKAYVGGPNFKYFKYDNAKQGKRQCGSTIKPFVYTFAFSQLGLDPCTPVPNLQVTIETFSPEPWTPKEAGRVEYDGVFHPLKWGLARSRNNYTAWIMKQAKSPEAVADFIHNLGIRSWIDPVHALALGTMDVSLFELVGAYTTFANHGVNIEPIFVTRIEDRQGNLLASFIPEATDAISETTAYTTLQVLQEVVNAGTAGRLRRAPYAFTGQVGGKTGTSQENRDAWFVGVAPNLVAGAWVGGEDQSIHPTVAGEGSVLALPIYGEFMKRVYADPKLGVRETDTFDVPPGAVYYNCSDVESVEASVTVKPVKEDEFFD
ncbi:MAG: transglycosylase domain-containing protein [Rikenellaceae bacterium]|jgi:penicillin-binding protein 1A|nr:transglycosylase domain-containing protein [Rikenellaceae bacterium]